MKKFLYIATCSIFFSFYTLFAATVTGVSPLVGPTTGGTTVTITGSGFSGATQVFFGTTQATSFVVNSPNNITAVTAAATASNVDIIVHAPSGVSLANPSDIFTFQGDWFAYVGTFVAGGIGPINLLTNTLQSTIAVGANGIPISSVVTPDNRLLIAGDDNNSTLVFIDLATSAITSTISLPGVGAGATAITPDGQFVYVVNEFSETVNVVNVANPSLPIVSITLPVGSFPTGIAITPDGTRAYIANAGNDTVSVIDTSNNTIIDTLIVGATPTDAAATPNGQYVLVNNQNNNNVSVITPINNQIVATVTVGDTPSRIAVTPDGLFAYTINFGDGTMSRIDLNTLVAETTISGISQGAGLAFTPNSDTGYVSNSISSGTVTPIDLTTNPETVLTPISGFSFPGGVTITPDQAPVARFTVTLKKTGSASTFNASQSVSPVGTITSYAWNFGDGTQITTTSPTVTHTYHSGGQFTVTLTVTNSAGTSTDEVFTGQSMSNSGSSYFAMREKSVNVQLRKPKPFKGKVIASKKRGKYKLQTHWRKPKETTVTSYEIFQHHRRIKKISVKHHRHHHFVKILEPSDFFKTHSRSYKSYLHKKYKIRAVDNRGTRSSFRHLKIHKLK